MTNVNESYGFVSTATKMEFDFCQLQVFMLPKCTYQVRKCTFEVPQIEYLMSHKVNIAQSVTKENTVILDILRKDFNDLDEN